MVIDPDQGGLGNANGKKGSFSFFDYREDMYFDAGKFLYCVKLSCNIGICVTGVSSGKIVFCCEIELTKVGYFNLNISKVYLI